MAYVIIALGAVLLAVRFWAAKAQAKREELREERMAKLLEERAAILEAHGPSSLGGVVSDSDRGARGAEDAAHDDAAKATERVKVRCRACRALNDEDATACASCGAEL